MKNVKEKNNKPIYETSIVTNFDIKDMKELANKYGYYLVNNLQDLKRVANKFGFKLVEKL
jgi:hypothetical protein